MFWIHGFGFWVLGFVATGFWYDGWAFVDGGMVVVWVV